MNKNYFIVILGVIAVLSILHFLKTSDNATAQFRPCVWPNTCSRTVAVAQFHPCVWPNTCANNNG